MSHRTTVKWRSQVRVRFLVAGFVRTYVQQLLDFDEEHSREWNRLAGELLDRQADRFPALTQAIASGAFAPDDTDSLGFGLARNLDGVQSLIDRGRR